MCKQKRKHVKRSWHVKISRMSKVSICFTRCNTTQKIVWKFCRSSDHATKSTATLYCTLDSECGLFRSLLA